MARLESTKLRNFEDRLELLDQSPFVHRDLWTVEFLQCVDARARDMRVQRVLLFEMTAVQRLVIPFNLDRDGGLALLADGDCLVLAFD